jgi:hypothetical protein
MDQEQVHNKLVHLISVHLLFLVMLMMVDDLILVMMHWNLVLMNVYYLLIHQ